MEVGLMVSTQLEPCAENWLDSFRGPSQMAWVVVGIYSPGRLDRTGPAALHSPSLLSATASSTPECSLHSLHSPQKSPAPCAPWSHTALPM